MLPSISAFQPKHIPTPLAQQFPPSLAESVTERQLQFTFACRAAVEASTACRISHSRHGARQQTDQHAGNVDELQQCK